MALKEKHKNGHGGNLGFEADLFRAADKLRGNMEPSDYKHVALGLIFLKYISDAFEAKHKALMAEDAKAAEDKDEYLAENVFWVPKKARWSHLQANAKQPTIGTLIDDAMRAIEKDNESLKGVLPKDYARPELKNWFIDYEPVRAKVYGRKAYLPSDLWKLFSDRLDDETNPVGWEKRAKGDCFRLPMVQSHPGDGYKDTGDGLTFFQGRTDFGFRYPEHREYCSVPTNIADKEETLASVYAPVRDIHLAGKRAALDVELWRCVTYPAREPSPITVFGRCKESCEIWRAPGLCSAHLTRSRSRQLPSSIRTQS